MFLRALCILSLIFAMCAMNRSEICNLKGEERIINLGLMNDVVQVCFGDGNDLQWTYICDSGWSIYGDPNSEVYCKRFGYIRQGFGFVSSTSTLFSGTEKLTNLDCFGNETSLTDCPFSTTTEACQLVSYVACEECQTKFDCRTITKCKKRHANSTFRSCLCTDECMNGGFCFNEICICPVEYTGSSCEINIAITAEQQEQTTTTTITTYISSTVREITESQTTSIATILTTGIQTGDTNYSTQTNTLTTKSQIPKYSMTQNTFTSQQTTNTIGSLNIKSDIIMPSSSLLSTTATILSSKIQATNHQTFPSTTKITYKSLNSDSPTQLVYSQEQCAFGRSCRVRKDRRTIRIIFSTISGIILLSIALIIACLFCCVCRLYCKVKKYRKLSLKRQTTEIITNLMSRDQTMSVPIDLEVSPYYTHIPDETEDRERTFESIFGQQTPYYLQGETDTQEIDVGENTTAFHNQSFTVSNQESIVDNELPLSTREEINFYHKLVDSQEIATDIFAREVSIINQLIMDRKVGVFDYIEPPYNLSELSDYIGHSLNEIATDNLKIGDIFATGNFGVISKAVYTTKYGDIQVAIKTLRDEANDDLKIAFTREAAILAQFNHPNILKFIGIVSTVEPNMIVTELLSLELRQFLIQLYHTKNNSYQNKRKLHKLQIKFCREIADGMAHLVHKKFIHRDLAARNILIANDMSCRIADFGMSRNLTSEDYYKSKGGQIPLRWTAPEAILYNRYSEKSDVWAYGMTLYEIWTLGCKPWQDNTNEDIIGFIEGGEMPLQPGGCPDDVYNIMMQTWRYSSADRPGFSEIKQMLSKVNLLPFSTSSVFI